MCICNWLYIGLGFVIGTVLMIFLSVWFLLFLQKPEKNEFLS